VIDHVTIRVSDRSASERFYETVLRRLGIEVTARDGSFVEWDDFSITRADAEHPVTRGLHIAWAAPSREHVHAFWQAGVDAGFRDDGEPGPRPQYGDDYYGGFLLDPDGNSAEAVHFDGQQRPLSDDRPTTEHLHLAFRAADGDASVDAFHAAATAAGYGDNGAPRERAAYHPGYDAAFVIDRDGHNVEVVHHNR
jgi:catechol 2,3-dioxygenase-like lactoylglutathione lyase family enzyme